MRDDTDPDAGRYEDGSPLPGPDAVIRRPAFTRVLDAMAGAP